MFSFPGLSFRAVGGAMAALLAMVLAGCSPRADVHQASADVVAELSGPSDPGFARALAPRPLVFPQDHGPHPEFATEWWYYTGNLQDPEGQDYGYQLTFFRTALAPQDPDRPSRWATTQVYMAHFALTSAPAGRHVAFDRFSRGTAGLAGAQGVPTFQVWLEDWQVQQVGPGRYRLQAREPTAEGLMALDLSLRETRPPVLHGDRGLSQKGPEPGNASYYYSLVNLETTGVLTFAGEAVSVQGLSWMDHEFGTSALSGDAVGWDWFSAQLDNGMVLMFGRIRNADGSSQPYFEGTLLYPDGRQVRLAPEDFELRVLGSWTSPQTGIVYPQGWQVRFPAHGLELWIEPIVADQEMRVGFVYYEGATRIRGTLQGAPVQGRGFVELTGYGGRRSAR